MCVCVCMCYVYVKEHKTNLLTDYIGHSKYSVHQITIMTSVLQD